MLCKNGIPCGTDEGWGWDYRRIKSCRSNGVGWSYEQNKKCGRGDDIERTGICLMKCRAGNCPVFLFGFLRMNEIQGFESVLMGGIKQHVLELDL